MSRIGGVTRVVIIMLFAGALANCASKEELKKRFAGRWGPDPAIQESEAKDFSERQSLVLQYIAAQYSIGTPGENGARFLDTTDWIRVTKAGFNVGREDCETYIDNLFRMARERQRNDSIINAANLASNAILQATKVTKAVSIVGASLGMLTGVNDAIYDSYLFSQAPGLIGEKVKDVQSAYRISIEQNPGAIMTAEDAYNAIQSYYSYCLPHSIEGMLLQKIAESSPKTETPGAPAPKKPASKSGSNGAAILNQRIKLQ